MKAMQSYGYRSTLLAVLAAVLASALLVVALPAPEAQAGAGDRLAAISVQDTSKEVAVGDFTYMIYYDEDNNPTSIWISGYTGSATEVTIPTSFTYDGKTLPLSGGEMIVGSDAFADNTKITKVAIPNGVELVGNRAFKGCTALTEVAIGDEVGYVDDDAFAGCPNLKTYLISGKNLEASRLKNSGIGVDASGAAYQGVTVYTVEGSPVVAYVAQINAKGGNRITVEYVTDPYSLSTVKATEPDSDGAESGSSSGSSASPSTAKTPKPATPYSPGATAKAAHAALVKYSSEADPKGSVFNLLKAKATKLTKKSVKLSWSKVKGAKTYVVYGNKCGKKNKMVKLATVKKTSKVFKKVNKKKVKKGTYYKFIVVALDKNKKVLSTSKSVHAATPGGKVGNDKKVKTAAKKNKATVKVGKTFKLKGKAIPKSKKLKVKRHRKVSYESSNPAIAKVSKKGVVKGVKKGNCYVYAYAQNGICAKVKVTVK